MSSTKKKSGRRAATPHPGRVVSTRADEHTLTRRDRHALEDKAKRDAAASSPPSTTIIENAKVDRITIGTGAHDGRGFFTIGFCGGGWAQSVCPSLNREWIDAFIRICGRGDLFSCTGALVRIAWREPIRGSATMIAAVKHILEDGPEYTLVMDGGDPKPLEYP